jgi:hypothetical protein
MARILVVGVVFMAAPCAFAELKPTTQPTSANAAAETNFMLSPLCVSLRRPGEPVGRASPARQSDSNDNAHRRCRDILLLADLPPWQIKSRHLPAANQPDGQITSDFPKSCQAPFAKIFCFASDPNQFTDSHRPVPEEGRWPRHQRGAGCGGRGWCQARESGPDEWRCSGRRSRVVLTPQGWRQVCEKKRRRRWQQNLVTGESAK